MKTINMQKMQKQISPMQSKFINFGGGLDVITPAINTTPGTVSDSQNWYVDTIQGYKRIEGYERFDGQLSPSAGQYAVLNVTITGTVAVGNTVTGVTSTETAIVLAVITTQTPNQLILTKLSGTFTADEDLNVAAAKQAEAIDVPIFNGASTSLLDAQYLNLAADEYRSDITAVTGSGPIRGVFVLDDVVYAFRDNAGATSCDLWKSTSSGWTQVDYEEEVTFTAGNASIGDGDTLTQGGVTATIDRYMYLSGDVGAGAGVGKLVISGRAGGSFAAGAATSTGGGALTLDGVESAITMLTGGKFDVIVQNFGGATGTKRAYGCDGANRGWEFDGTVFAPIDTGMSPDMPEHCLEHKYHLFFSFGSSAQHSGTGVPYIWTPVFGASELAVGDDITGFQQEGGGGGGEGALAIISRNRTHILYGSTVDDWNLVPYRDELGGYEWSIQHIGSTVMVDDRGIGSLVTSEKYGNFEHGTISRLIRTWVSDFRSTIKTSCISREKSQYRLFFNNGITLYTTFDGTSVMGMMPQLLSHNMNTSWSGELNDGSEMILIGSDDGFVYQMDKGTSFDGGNIESYLIFHFIHFDTPYLDKEFFGGFFEAEGTSYAGFNLAYEFGYAKTAIPQALVKSYQTPLSSSIWDAFTWDAFTWDGKTIRPISFNMEGNGENVSLIIRANSDFNGSIKLSGVLFNYKPRIGLRYNDE